MSDMNLMMRIGATTDASFRRAFDHVNQSMDRISDLQGKFGQAFAMSSAGLAGFSAPLVGMAKSAIDFESSMAEVNKTVGFDSTESLNAFGNELKTLSTQIPLSVNELASITATGGQLGVAKENLLGFTRDVSEMSVAFDMTAEQAGDNMAKLMNAMGEPITAMREYGDAINAVSNSSPARANEIIESLGRVGQTGKNFGLVKEEIIALNGAFIATGSAPEVAATSVKGMLTTLSTLDPKSKKQRESLNKLGLGFESFSTMVKTKPQEAIMTMLESVNQIPKAERIGVLTGLFGKEYAGQIATLAGGIDTYTDQLKTLQAVDASGKPQYFGSMAKEFASIGGTTANKMQLFKNNLSLVAINIGEALIPSINQAMMALTPMIQSFSEWASANPELIVGITKVVGGLLLMGASLSGMGFIVLSVVRPIMQFANAFKMVGGAIKAVRLALLANPILGFALALSLVALAIYMNWDRIKPYFTALWNGLKTVFNIGVGAVKSAILNFTPLGFFIRNWTPIKTFVLGVWHNLKAFSKSGIVNILKTIASFSPLGLFVRLWGVVKPYFSRLWLSLKVKVVSGINIIKNIISAFTPLTLFTRAMQPLMPYFQGAWNKLKVFSKSGIGNILKTIASFSPLGLFIRAWSAVFSYFSGLGAKFRAYGANIIQGLIGGITAKLGVLKEKISGVASMMAGVFSGKLEINSPSRLFSRIAGSIPEGIGGGVIGGAHHALNAVNWLSNKIGSRTIATPKLSDMLTPASNDAHFGTRSNEKARTTAQAMQRRVEQTQRSNKVLASKSVNQQQSQSYVIHFNPTINANGAANDDTKAMQTIAKMTVQELERLLERVERNRTRRAFA